MRLLFLDIYKKSSSRISKDTAGGYGTENNLGDGILGRTISWVVKNTVFWPNLSFVQLMEEFEARGNECVYSKHIGVKEDVSENWDAIFVCSSIVCFETEIESINNILKSTNTPIFLCGTIAEHLKNMVPKKVVILSGNYEFLPQSLDNENKKLTDVVNDEFIRVQNGDSESLKIINWLRKDIPKTKNWFLGGRKAFFPFISTRGCPYSCFEYCTYPLSQGRKTLQEKNSSVVEKFKILSKKYGKAHVVFRDPVFSINIKQSKQLLKMIGDANLNIDFTAELHLKNIDDEFIELCKYAKFTWLKFGIESAIEHIRDSVNRHSIANDDQVVIINKLRKAKIKTVGMFILAQPEDTVETCNTTIDYACKLNLDLAQFSIFTPYPGTPYYNKNHLNINVSNYQDFNQYGLVYRHPKISKKVARQLLEKSYRKFLISKYSRAIF